ncbi:2'-5' RNA ligase family protein [Flavobacterium sp. NG2]|uniref:2'-5' RNA ligase family protein n=1 Tax=Flavobacterium sp. NG2 TaxID=3097547 RepID=UPI002A834B73|nr:2'-5' RNA ligase family protein [Flavobacterium sp. NG2]WPR70657.1 2'-5' RNA ligase family protein [Flavobacterium sp. NG2]
MQNRYSIVISPPDEIIALVKSMKEALAKEIGWFHSKNSLAHITINEFMATENEIESIKKQLYNICDAIQPKTVSLDHFDTFPNGAFFLAPDEVSKTNLKHILKQFNQSFKVKTLFKNSEPHLTIGRQLKSEHITIAYRLFSNPIAIQFVSDSIALRLFNPTKKQFEIIDRFDFNDNPKPTLEQGRLF